MLKSIILSVLVVSINGCALAWSPNFIEKEDAVTEETIYEVYLEWVYPKRQFMDAKEREAYKNLPDSQKEVEYQYYKEGEKTEDRWNNFINNCLLKLNMDC